MRRCQGSGMGGDSHVCRVLLWTIVCTCLMVEIAGQSRGHQAGRNSRRRFRNRNTARRVGEGTLPPDVHRMYIDAAAADSNGNPLTPMMTTPPTETLSEWHVHTPRLPAPHEVECYVEVMTVVQQGGRCTRLGGMLQSTICQSGQNVDFNAQCEDVIAAREQAEGAGRR